MLAAWASRIEYDQWPCSKLTFHPHQTFQTTLAAVSVVVKIEARDYVELVAHQTHLGSAQQVHGEARWSEILIVTVTLIG